jgi:glucose/arabinose dehydrogenase
MIQHYTRNRFLAILSLALLALPSLSQPVGTPVLSFTSFTSGLSAPVDIVNAGDGTNRLFIVQRGGAVRIHNGSSLLATPFINLQDSIISGGEQGLLSMAFHPDYETNRYFFVWYTDPQGDLTLARYQTTFANPNIADQQSEVILLEIPKPGNPYFNNHNGGKILFGPDGYLYVSIGDGGSGGDPFNNAQNGNSLLGKMLRLNVNNFTTPPYYSIPPDNPYVSDPNVRDEIWALGLRNPWRWSFDRQTGDVWIADVGQGANEEVNFRAAANTGPINYGWRCYEGDAAYNTSGCGPAANYVFPIFDYPHNGTTGGFSVTGGNVYRGPTYPLLTGWYIMADYISGNVWKIYPNGTGGWNVFMQTGLPGNIAGFGEAENGTLYAVGLGNGTIYRVEANSAIPVKLSLFNGEWKDNTAMLSWRTEFEQDVNRFEIQYSNTGTDFATVGTVEATNNANGNTYSFSHTPALPGKTFYRLAMIDNDGTVEYSRIVNLTNAGIIKTLIYPTIVENGILNIEIAEPVESVQLVSMVGMTVYKQKFSRQNGKIVLQLSSIEAGTYVLQVTGTENVITRQIIIR